MGFWRSLLNGSSPVPVLDQVGESDVEPTFAIDTDAIDPAVFGLTSYVSDSAPQGRIARKTAIQAGPVKRSRDLIAGTLGTLPVRLKGSDGKTIPWTLFEQPEPDVPRSVTMAKTFEDMFFEQVAWWYVLETGWHTYPTKVRRLDARSVDVMKDGRVHVTTTGHRGMVEEWPTDAQLIRFDSPNDGLLTSAAAAIRVYLAVQRTTGRNVDGAPPVDFFTPAEGADPAEDEEIQAILDGWRDARRERSTGYVPAALKYNVGGFNPEQLQLKDIRRDAALEIAEHAGVDPEDLGISTTSRTYANQFDRRKSFTDFTLGGYLSAMQDRLNMFDVTPRGSSAYVDLSEFQRSDDKTRYEAYSAGKAAGALTDDEIREAEGKPPIPKSEKPTPPPALPAAQPEENQVPAQLRSVQASFDSTTMDASAIPGGTVFAVDLEQRVIRGRAVPYGVVGIKNGLKFQFSQGTVHPREGMKVKLWALHEKENASGVVTEWNDTDAGLDVAFSVAKTPEGDRALAQADAGVWDGLSIGPSEGAKYAMRDGVYHSVDIPIHEISLTPAPVFGGARVSSVAFDVIQEGTTMQCTKCGVVHAAGVTECNPQDVTKFEAEKSAIDFSAFGDAIKDGLKAGFAELQFPQREVVPAGHQLQVTEPSPYRFDGTEGEHGFLSDIRAAHLSHDSEAKQRIDTFMEEAFESFAVTSGNVATLNPTQNRPDLYVPNLQFTRPLWEMCSTGVVTDKTPFTIPKFASAAGLVNAHTEGVEPTPGSFTATAQTVTPAPVSGKVEIVREVWDQGGSPKADAIVWGEMLNGYFEAIEAKIATLLNGLALTEVNLGSVTDAALINSLTNILVDLQFVRGGNRYSRFASDGMLFKAMVGAAATDGRKLLPVMGPANAQGQTDGGFDRVQLGTLTARAAWALGASNASNSYLFVPSSVWAWASAPKKFEFEYRVSAIDLAIWGYTATACLRDTDVKRLDYTSADV